MRFGVLALLACKGSTDDPTWHRDIEPIVVRSCARCHDGTTVAPGNWTDYASASLSAAAIAIEVSSGRMPPPTADPACRDYLGSDQMGLSDEEREMFVAWYEAGAPEGDPEDASETSYPPLHLDDADLTLSMPVEHTVSRAGDGNEYRCFILEIPTNQAFFINAFDTQLGNPEIVHHMGLFRDPQGRGGTLYGEPSAVSFECLDPVMDPQWEMLHAWGPGMAPTVLGDGLGMKIDPTTGEQLVLQVHYYNRTDQDQVDLSSYLVPRNRNTPV